MLLLHQSVHAVLDRLLITAVTADVMMHILFIEKLRRERLLASNCKFSSAHNVSGEIVAHCSSRRKRDEEFTGVLRNSCRVESAGDDFPPHVAR